MLYSVGVQVPLLAPFFGVHMWSLVLIVFLAGTPEATFMGNYNSIYDCFEDREYLSVDVGGSDGYFPSGMQAVCIYRDDVDIKM